MKKTSALHRLLGKILAVVVLSVATVGTLHAQTQRVSGTVTDANGEGAIGVTVVVKGDNTRAAVTDIDGAYTITTRPDDVLVFSHVGYQTREVAVAGRATVDVQLGDKTTIVDEVVVLGYGSQRRQFVVGSGSQGSNKELNITPSSNVSSMVAGKLPGLTAIQRSGQPGEDHSSIQVRGISTFGDNKSPLVLVDGIPRDWNAVNPLDIETVTVLKDAATTSIYGIQGGNGVVLVTTKSGATGPATITYSGNVTFATNTNFPELLNAQDYMGWHNLARQMDGLDPYWTPENVQRMKDMGIYGETDWMGEVFKPFGLDNYHTISASGGTDRIKYYASIGMLDQDGIVPGTTHRRFNVRSNVDIKIAKNFNLKLNLSGYQDKRHEPGFGLIEIGVQNEYNPVTMAIYSLPNLATTYTEPETGDVYYLGSRISNTSSRNPLAYINESGHHERKNWKFEGSAQLEYDFGSIAPLKGLKAGMFVAYDFLATNDYTYGRGFDMYTYYFNDPVGAMPSTVTKITAEGTDDTKKNSYTELASHSENILLRPMLTYEREFGRHRVDAVFLYEQRNNHNRYLNATKKGYYSDYPLSISMGDTWHEDGEIAPVTGSFGETASIGVAGRINYAFDRKYLAQFSFRSDATYKFAPENRWGFFPSAAVGWVMSEEKFIKDAGTPINYLKITASYGETGSDDTDAFLYMPKYKMTPSYGYIFGGEGKSVYFTDGFAYRDLTWSTMRTYDAGFEAELWQGKFGIEFKWFYKLTDDILERVGGSYPPSLGGYAPAWKNSGKMDNRGFELVLKHNNRFPNGWAYSLKGTLSWAHNRVLARQIGDDHSVLYQKILGEPLGSIYGLKATGFYQTQEQIDNSPYGPADDKRLGDLMYADINGDGLVSAGDYRDTRYLDYVKIGNSENPEMNFSLNMSVSWKGLSLTTLWYGVAITSYQLASYYNPRGDYIGYPDATMHTRPFYANGNAPYHLVENAWREDNRDAKYPRLSTQFTSTSAWPSSWWVKNGAYLRLRELALSYDLPEKIMSRVGIKGARVTLSGQNLLTFSAYKYVDPEAPSVNNGYYPQRRTYTIGLDLTF